MTAQIHESLIHESLSVDEAQQRYEALCEQIRYIEVCDADANPSQV